MTRLLPFFALILFFAVFSLPADAAPDDIDALLKTGQYQQALAELDRLPAEEQDNPNYLFSRARALAAIGQLDKAIVQYQGLIKLRPDLPEPYNNLAVIYMQQNKMKQARDLLNQAMATHPAYARIYKNLTAVNAARARDAYAKALQMPAKNPAQGLEMAQNLSLPRAQTSRGRSAPHVTDVTKPAAKPAMVYQADTAHADKDTEYEVKNQPLAKAEAVAVEAMLRDWAQAWSTKSVAQYLHFYVDDYSTGGLTHQAWAAQRKARITKPRWIRVTLRNFQVTEAGPERVRVRLEQEYAADNYSDVTKKEFLLQKTDGQWRIFKERGLGYIAR